MADAGEPSGRAEAPIAVSPTVQSPSPAGDRDADSLAALVATATAKYAVKDYLQAAESYSQATELQAQLNGEMALENADLLYNYGKCLYHVAVKNSDVLGGEAAGAELGIKQVQAKQGRMEQHDHQTPLVAKEKRDTERPVTGDSIDAEAAPSPAADGEQKQAEETVAALVEKMADRSGDTRQGEQPTADKPYFQFTGDENWDDSEDDGEEDGEADGAAAERGEADGEEDDFANAFEVLDLSRILYRSKLEQLQDKTPADSEKGKALVPAAGLPEVLAVKERIADIHDLQAEIALEGERFSNAVVDLKAALSLKEELFPRESPLLAECHYKLSLALEFSSVTQQRDQDGNVQGEASIDQEARDEAASELSKAIESCKLRIAKEERELEGLQGEEIAPQRQKLKLSVEDVAEMVSDMELRLVELRKPPVSINDPKGTGSLDGSTPLGGILGQILGESQEEQTKRLEEASVAAKDLTGLIKRKKVDKSTSTTAEATPTASASVTGSGAANLNGDAAHSKRKAVGFVDEIEEVGRGKRAKMEDGT